MALPGGDLLLLLGAGFIAGGMNAIAGGGSFVSFPAMILAGLTPVAANVSSTVALFPAALASTWAFRRDIVRVGGVPFGAMLLASMGGGLLGAGLLLATPNGAFRVVVPWLLLLAALTFAFGSRLGAALRRRVRIGRRTMLGVQFILAIYGGYFGGAVGLMMMAVWGLVSGAELKVMNPAKVLLVGMMNFVAIVCFVIAGAVCWRQTIPTLLSAIAGGYGGALLARRLPAPAVRAAVIVLTFGITAAFFWTLYGP